MHRSIAIGVAALLASGAAFAQTVQVPEQGWYIGGDVSTNSGPRGGDIDASFANQGIPGTSSSVDDNKLGWGLNLGYRFHRNWAAELGYRDLGEFGYSSSSPAGGMDGKYKANAWSLSGLYLFPVTNSNFTLYGKLGVARSDTSRDVSSQSPGLTATSANSTRTGWLAGLGATYDFSSKWFTKVAWDHYDRVGDSNTGKTNIDAFSLGVGLRF